MQRQYLPYIFILSSTFSVSISGLLSKFLADQVSIEWLGFLRFFMPSMLLMLILFCSKFRFPPKQMLLPLCIRAGCIAACQLCFIYSLSTLSLVEGVVLFATGPLFIPLLEKLIFGVRLKLGTVIGLGMTFVGVLMLSGNVSGFHFQPALLVGLAAGVFNAGSQLSLHRATKSDLSPVEINAWTLAFASLIFIPLLLTGWFFNHGAHFNIGNSSDIIILLTLLVVSVLIINTQVFRAKAYKLVESSSQLAPLLFTNLLFTSIWQALFFDVSFSYLQLAGLVVIVSANVINVATPIVFEKWRHRKDHAIS
ncbi:DMT family transporter [Vibrio sp. S4M6]|uniref:DMT family transporter n=1 Tax=Vibrio sinus TaxID=2946865 RepID=UPI002029E93C|nr:DMT family transporter [Vibrio sinus]MCL9780106.1 DMT family transporter [Vibrio sinus]